MADFKTELGKVTLKNPVMTASGTFGYGYEYAELYPLDKLGAVVVKGISLDPVSGNPMPRHAEITSGVINAVGLQNPGVEEFINGEKYLPFLRKSNAAAVINIWGKTINEYVEVAEILNEQNGITALEINISCPNIKEGGIAFGTDLKMANKVVSEIRKVTTLPLVTKLSPNVTRIADFAKTVVDAGSDMISLINTLTGMVIDIETRKPVLANKIGGVSGPAVKPVAVKLVHEVYNAVDVPIIGMGGIQNGSDAIEFMLAGADAVAVGTAVFSDPYAPLKVIEEIGQYLDRHNIKSVKDIVGRLESV
ncbi:MAG: dihydroorotate dehydrogenase [Victivallales bacterium]|nr:dihydroorotate dehydrogenase [Victivallales bacterium]MCF7888702.1 dihydroorotate dehydrogenase [Victivallales bacterium]